MIGAMRSNIIGLHRKWWLIGLSFIICHLSFSPAGAQELQAKININHSKIQGTDASVFENLQQTLQQTLQQMLLIQQLQTQAQLQAPARRLLLPCPLSHQRDGCMTVQT